MIDPQREQELLWERVQALRKACRESHKDGAGGAAMCICGAGGGGSAACSALMEIRNILAVAKVPPAYRKTLAFLKESL